MSLLQKFKTNSYCFGGRHYSDTKNIRRFITAKVTKKLNDNYTKCKRNNSMKQ